MNAKQDRQGVRRVADLEQKYRFDAVFKNQEAKNKEQTARLDAQNMSIEQFRQYAVSYFDTLEIAVKQLTSENQMLSDELAQYQQKNDQELNELAQNISSYWETIYPVGSVYASLNKTEPETLFGGNWERIKDTFLLSAGDNFQAGSTGGEVEHVLTIDEMPEHQHAAPVSGEVSGDIGESYPDQTILCDVADASVQYLCGYTDHAGGSVAHNNMPPYVAVYMWKRIA